MSIKKFVKTELSGWGKFEKILFPLSIFTVILISVYLNDNKIALVSAVCGISYTILAGKGKISCYFIGLAGTMCYAYLAYKNAIYGNFLLYTFYYIPMQILGIFKWRKHFNRTSMTITKTVLNCNEKILFLFAAVFFSFIMAAVLKKYGDTTPVIDAVTTVFSVTGLILTVKRCLEQWYIWIIVNGLSIIMWWEIYISGSNCLATILMWGIYFILAIYFLHSWKQEIVY